MFFFIKTKQKESKGKKHSECVYSYKYQLTRFYEENNKETYVWCRLKIQLKYWESKKNKTNRQQQ